MAANSPPQNFAATQGYAPAQNYPSAQNSVPAEAMRVQANPAGGNVILASNTSPVGGPASAPAAAVGRR